MTARRLVRFDPELPPEEAAAWLPHLTAAGYRTTAGGDWTLYLARALPPDEVYSRLEPDRRVNRFPGIGALALKDSLLANVRSALWWSDGDELFLFHPTTFRLPEEEGELRAAAAREPRAVWILKRRASTRGRGMRLLDDLDELPDDGRWMVQRYVDRPHLLDGHKYNLRFYLLLTSLEPLVCWVHRVGTCRFASRPYSLAPGAFEDPVVHLTNTEVQARNRDSPWWARDTDLVGYRDLLKADGADPETLFRRIRAALVGMLLACREELLIASRARTDHPECCFDFLGVDVQIDEEMKPWILEANAGPPMELEPFEDPAAARSQAVKDALMGDLVTLLDGEPGGWERLWPGADAVQFERGFPLLRPADRRTAAEVCPDLSRGGPTPRPAPGVDTRQLGDSAALYEPARGRILALNSTGALVWLGLQQGLAPEAVADELAALFPDTPRRRIDDDLWDLLVAWAQAGALAGFEPRPRNPTADPLTVPATRRSDELVVAVGNAELGGWGKARPTALPVPTVRRLRLILPPEEEPPADGRCSPAAALEALGRGLEGRPLARSPALRLITWLDSLESFAVEPASARRSSILPPS